MTKLGSFFRDFFTPLIVLVVGGVVAYDHLVVREPVVVSKKVDGKLLGRKFAGSIASTFGDAWTVAADSLEQGKSMAEVQASMQTRWQADRSKAFAEQVGPEFSKVLGEGGEPTDPTQRAEVVQLWRDFAVGLKGARP